MYKRCTSPVVRAQGLRVSGLPSPRTSREAGRGSAAHHGGADLEIHCTCGPAFLLNPGLYPKASRRQLPHEVWGAYSRDQVAARVVGLTDDVAKREFSSLRVARAYNLVAARSFLPPAPCAWGNVRR